MFIDSHAHLDMLIQDSFNMESLEPYLGNKLDKVIHISLNPDDFLQHHPILSQSSKILFAVGWYPSYANDPQLDFNLAYDQLKKIAQQYSLIAIGECGVDLKDESYGPLAKQQNLFALQIELAQELSLPIIIHSRMSFNETTEILTQATSKAILHCFSYGIKEAEFFLDRGDYISFAGMLTYPKSEALHEVARIIPLDRILFETDSPYLSPVPFRGKTNNPNNVALTYQFFAELRNISIEELCHQVKLNFNKVFNTTL